MKIYIRKPEMPCEYIWKYAAWSDMPPKYTQNVQLYNMIAQVYHQKYTTSDMPYAICHYSSWFLVSFIKAWYMNIKFAEHLKC